jgi:hypothetical protein
MCLHADMRLKRRALSRTDPRSASNRPDTTLMTNYWFSWRASDYADSKGHVSSSQSLFPVGSRHNRVVGMFLVHIHANTSGAVELKHSNPAPQEAPFYIVE